MSGFPAQPLASHPYTLLRDSISNIVAKAGVAIPAGSNAYKVLGMACGTHSPDCQKIIDAVKASAASRCARMRTATERFLLFRPGRTT
jgi:hypothetical protein